jgi:hypothetical protein
MDGDRLISAWDCCEAQKNLKKVWAKLCNVAPRGSPSTIEVVYDTFWPRIKTAFDEAYPAISHPNPFAPIVDSGYSARLRAAIDKNEDWIANCWFAFEELVAPIQRVRRRSDGFLEVIDFERAVSITDGELFRAAFNRYVIEQNSYRIKDYSIVHIDKNQIRGKPDLENDVKLSQVGVELLELDRRRVEIEENIVRLRAALANPYFPPDAPEEYYPPVDDFTLPENHVYELRGGVARAGRLRQKGIVALKDIALSELECESHKIQVNCAKSGARHVNQPELAKFIGKLKYPVSFLDFETFATPWPLIVNCAPWQQIPFMFSLHVKESSRATPKWFSYLHASASDPRESLVRNLLNVLPKEGSILAYNSQFEAERLNEIGECFDHLGEQIAGVNPRFEDLWAPFRSLHLYDPKQKGCTGLKAVYGAWIGDEYSKLAIANGEEASAQYLRANYQLLGAVTTEEVAHIHSQITQYCKLDTAALPLILERIELESGVFSKGGIGNETVLQRHLDMRLAAEGTKERLAGQIQFSF